MKPAKDRGLRRRLLIVAVLLAALLAGHYYFWYWPRPRDGRPDSESLAGRQVLSREGLSFRLWLPFPHQNLSALEQHLGTGGALRRVSVELSGFDVFEVPTFGPFRVPPSREMLFATDEERDQVLLVARIYPLVRWVLRTAGWVAGNPWLAGGEVRLSERVVTVRWVEGDWIASTTELKMESTAEVRVDEDMFAALRIQEAVGVVPGGLYSLQVGETGLSVTSVENRFPVRTTSSDAKVSAGVALLSANFPRGEDRAEANVLALLVPSSDRGEKAPGAVVVHRGVENRWSLPGERLLSVAGVRPVSVIRKGWSVWAYDDVSLETGTDLIPLIETLQQSASAEGVASIGEINLAEARVAVELIDRVIGAIPLVGRTEARQWAAISSLMQLLSEYSTISYRIGQSPDRLEMIIE